MSAVKKLRACEQNDIGLTDWDRFVTESPAPDWMKAIRLRGREAYQACGLPTAAMERFKYTDIAAALKNVNLKFDSADVVPVGCTEYLTPIMAAADKFPAWAKAMAESTPAGMAQYGDMNLWHAVNAYLRDG